jgi:hypothetical protein
MYSAAAVGALQQSSAARVSVAAWRQSPSSSQASLYLFNRTLTDAMCYNGGHIALVADKKWYNLRERGKQLLGKDFGTHNHRTQSDAACAILLRSLLSQERFNVNTHQHIPLLKESAMPELLVSKEQIPDISLQLRQDITAGTLVEVHSSSYKHTVTKALLVGTDLLRLRRTYDVSQNSITVFSFPKLPTHEADLKQCVVEITIC